MTRQIKLKILQNPTMKLLPEIKLSLEDKTRLIEILLVVVSILVVFGYSTALKWTYMLFIMFSIVLFVAMRNKIWEHQNQRIAFVTIYAASFCSTFSAIFMFEKGTDAIISKGHLAFGLIYGFLLFILLLISLTEPGDMKDI